MSPGWLHPLVRLFGLLFAINGMQSSLRVIVGDAALFVSGGIPSAPVSWWLSNLAGPSLELAAGLWFFFGTRQVISILMRGRFAAHCCQHCGYDPGPNRPERCPECARAFPVIQSEPPASPPSSSAST